MITLKKSIIILTTCVTSVVFSSCQNQTQDIDPNGLSQAALLTVACASCHSKPGMGVPKLTNLSEERLVKYLTYYKTDETGTSVMHRLSRGFSEDEIKLIAKHYGHEK